MKPLIEGLLSIGTSKDLGCCVSFVWYKYCYLHTMDELQALCMLSHLILTPCEVVTISICIVQMGKLRLREFRWLALGHMASK